METLLKYYTCFLVWTLKRAIKGVIKPKIAIVLIGKKGTPIYKWVERGLTYHLKTFDLLNVYSIQEYKDSLGEYAAFFVVEIHTDMEWGRNYLTLDYNRPLPKYKERRVFRSASVTTQENMQNILSRYFRKILSETADYFILSSHNPQ